jgi:hypothetical protein
MNFFMTLSLSTACRLETGIYWRRRRTPAKTQIGGNFFRARGGFEFGAFLIGGVFDLKARLVGSHDSDFFFACHESSSSILRLMVLSQIMISLAIAQSWRPARPITSHA